MAAAGRNEVVGQAVGLGGEGDQGGAHLSPPGRALGQERVELRLLERAVRVGEPTRVAERREIGDLVVEQCSEARWLRADVERAVGEG